jgi:superfamily II DNA or RNA helicase
MMDKIILRVENNSTFILGKLHKDIYQGLRKHVSYMPLNAAYLIKNKGSNNGWDGSISTICYSRSHCKCFVPKDGVHFPTGLLSKVRNYLKDFDVDVSLVDNRSKVSKTIGYSLDSNCILRDYQKEVIDLSYEVTRGIVKVATGGGKTVIAAGLISKLGVAPFVFYVTSIDLLEQAYSSFNQFIRVNGQPIEIGRIGGKYCEIKDITIMTIQTAVRAFGAEYEKLDEEEKEENDSLELTKKYVDIKNLILNTKGLIVDEVQHVARKSCQIVLDNCINAKYKYGFSATPYRDLGDDILIEGCFGKTISDISASFLIRKGYLIKPTINIVPVNNMRGTKFFSYSEAYKKAIAENTYRNSLISKIVMNMAENDRKILILVKNIRHGNILQALIKDCFFINGSHTGDERKNHIELMKKGLAKITCATSIFDEGIDRPILDTLVLCGAGKSSTRALQRVGRVIRPYTNGEYVKKDAVVIEFKDDVKYMLDHFNKRIKIYKTEPEFDIDFMRIP